MNPATRNPILSRLDSLVGEWELSATFGDESFEGGRTIFRWMDDADFLVQRTEAGKQPPELPKEMIENMPEPVTTVFGLDDSSEQFTMLYSDARGVVRVYQMSLEGGRWAALARRPWISSTLHWAIQPGRQHDRRLLGLLERRGKLGYRLPTQIHQGERRQGVRMLLEAKVAVIYGGGPISAAVIDAFVREGARVYLAGRNQEKLDTIAGNHRKNGKSIETAIVDALDEDAINNFVDSVVSKEGRLDISFNLISLGDVQQLLADISIDGFLQPIMTAMRSHFLTTCAAARQMMKQRAGVILTFGGGGPQTLPGLGGFKISLDALEGLRRQWACELGEYGIRVVTLKTGGIPESISPDFEGRDAIAASIEQATLLKRTATLLDVGDVAAFVASDKARTLTSSDVNISCGSIVD